ncbi:glycosyltransferase family 4 protein [Chryseobacterium camelliae]|uniref:glycosyltransferase family 4 protein n=1 Tax=Chryseobacterium camelliae TaxID=1265445 RepID=UPI002866785A|nr:glycosyltransferase family 4 protein [Chryseobacterium camelliae]MDR6516358.1 glycosyltransferase involved in cell wall biosynthesis [Chryseobacterium camelliae]
MAMTCYIVSYNGIANAGGVERVCYYLNEIFREKNYNVVIIDSVFVMKSKPGKIYNAIFGKIHALAFPIMSSLLLRNIKGDVITVSHGFNCPFIASDLLFIHGTMKGHDIAVNQRETFANKIMHYFEKKAVKNAKKIISVSAKAIEEVKEYYHSVDDKKFHVLNNTVDDKIFYPRNRIKKVKKTILFCGRLGFGKGLNELLYVANLLEGQNQFELIIATNNSNNSNLFDKYTNVIVKVGLQINELNDFYNLGDILFMPSLYEGFEMITLEALCSGIPVLGNNVGAISELISRNEPGVILYEKKYDFFKQISEIINNYENEGERLHSYYSQNYGIASYKIKLQKVINSI